MAKILFVLLNCVAGDLRKLCLGLGLIVGAFVHVTMSVSSAQAQDTSETRVALLIGNGAYQNVPELKNPRNDSADLADALEAVGFEVFLHTDQTQGTMLDTLRGFRRKASRAEIAVVYFAGHGIEIDRQNYLIPVDAVLETDSDINFEAVPLDTMIFAASGASRLSMVIVDACRNNPFAASIQRTSSSRSIGRGLSAVEPTRNTLVAYAAKEGTTAADGAGRNSPYATALLAALKEPNLEVGLMMRRVRDEVLASTGGAQEPFVYGSLSADQIYLNETRGLSLVSPGSDASRQQDATAAEVAFWQSVSQSDDPRELESYLARYPDGVFAGLARSRLARLNTSDTASLKPLVKQTPESEPEANDTAPLIDDRSLNRSEVVELQERLSALGHSLGRADGIPGRRTSAAVRAFEQQESLPETGEASLTVLTALRSKVSDTELRAWRAKQQAARTTTQRRTQPSNTATPKPAEPTTEAEAPSTAKTPSFTKFCQSNRQCATTECRRGADGKIFANKRSCQFCRAYTVRCE